MTAITRDQFVRTFRHGIDLGPGSDLRAALQAEGIDVDQVDRLDGKADGILAGDDVDELYDVIARRNRRPGIQRHGAEYALYKAAKRSRFASAEDARRARDAMLRAQVGGPRSAASGASWRDRGGAAARPDSAVREFEREVTGSPAYRGRGLLGSELVPLNDQDRPCVTGERCGPELTVYPPTLPEMEWPWELVDGRELRGAVDAMVEVVRTFGADVEALRGPAIATAAQRLMRKSDETHELINRYRQAREQTRALIEHRLPKVMKDLAAARDDALAAELDALATELGIKKSDLEAVQAEIEKRIKERGETLKHLFGVAKHLIELAVTRKAEKLTGLIDVAADVLIKRMARWPDRDNLDEVSRQLDRVTDELNSVASERARVRLHAARTRLSAAIDAVNETRAQLDATTTAAIDALEGLASLERKYGTGSAFATMSRYAHRAREMAASVGHAIDEERGRVDRFEADAEARIAALRAEITECVQVIIPPDLGDRVAAPSNACPEGMDRTSWLRELRTRRDWMRDETMDRRADLNALEQSVVAGAAYLRVVDQVMVDADRALDGQ
ncbi:MAG: hypothetical protein D6689_19425 [Deltaproteobacteria bacterium]|nr:MAG: hypothetical protein D6689_19425 [Deltaproteobacteria bacterium]